MGQSCMHNKKLMTTETTLQSIKPITRPKKPSWELHYHQGRPETQEDIDFDIDTKNHIKKAVRFSLQEQNVAAFSQGVKYQKQLLMKEMFSDMYVRKKYTLIRSNRENRQKEYKNRINQTLTTDLNCSPLLLSLQQINLNNTEQSPSFREEAKSIKSLKSPTKPISGILKQRQDKAFSSHSVSKSNVRFQK